jgi:histidinol-phosphate phosphatase family protein
MLNLADINASWTLFLDRDGVINEEKEKTYVLHYGEFLFYPNAKEGLQILSEIFGLILIVTNQRGVGKGLMTEKDLRDIHQRMREDIQAAGGRVDGIYYNISTNDADFLRKPNPGMALQAKRDFPAIDLTCSVMVGNTLSDMEFGRNAGMHTVFLSTTQAPPAGGHLAIDRICTDLLDFAKALQKS